MWPKKVQSLFFNHKIKNFIIGTVLFCVSDCVKLWGIQTIYCSQKLSIEDIFWTTNDNFHTTFYSGNCFELEGAVDLITVYPLFLCTMDDVCIFKASKAISRPGERPFGLCSNFFWKFSKVYPKGAGICKKKVFWKNVPRLPAFKTTFSFWKNFLWSYPSKLNQIQIMWLFWPKIYFHFKILAF